MKTLYFSVAVLLVSVSEWVYAGKLTGAHVALNPSQGYFGWRRIPEFWQSMDLPPTSC
jgi:hypothetical protein